MAFAKHRNTPLNYRSADDPRTVIKVGDKVAQFKFDTGMNLPIFSSQQLSDQFPDASYVDFEDYYISKHGENAKTRDFLGCCATMVPVYQLADNLYLVGDPAERVDNSDVGNTGSKIVCSGKLRSQSSFADRWNELAMDKGFKVSTNRTSDGMRKGLSYSLPCGGPYEDFVVESDGSSIGWTKVYTSKYRTDHYARSEDYTKTEYEYDSATNTGEWVQKRYTRYFHEFTVTDNTVPLIGTDKYNYSDMDWWDSYPINVDKRLDAHKNGYISCRYPFVPQEDTSNSAWFDAYQSIRFKNYPGRLDVLDRIVNAFYGQSEQAKLDKAHWNKFPKFVSGDCIGWPVGWTPRRSTITKRLYIHTKENFSTCKAYSSDADLERKASGTAGYPMGLPDGLDLHVRKLAYDVDLTAYKIDRTINADMEAVKGFDSMEGNFWVTYMESSASNRVYYRDLKMIRESDSSIGSGDLDDVDLGGGHSLGSLYDKAQAEYNKKQRTYIAFMPIGAGSSSKADVSHNSKSALFTAFNRSFSADMFGEGVDVAVYCLSPGKMTELPLTKEQHDAIVTELGSTAIFVSTSPLVSGQPFTKEAWPSAVEFLPSSKTDGQLEADIKSGGYPAVSVELASLGMDFSRKVTHSSSTEKGQSGYQPEWTTFMNMPTDAGIFFEPGRLSEEFRWLRAQYGGAVMEQIVKGLAWPGVPVTSKL